MKKGNRTIENIKETMVTVARFIYDPTVSKQICLKRAVLIKTEIEKIIKTLKFETEN